MTRLFALCSPLRSVSVISVASALAMLACGGGSENDFVYNPDPNASGGSGQMLGNGGAGIGDASLAAVYSDYFGIGVAIEPNHLDDHPDIITKHFNRITAENAMKFGSLSTGPDSYDWSGADRLADFARDNDMAMTGHALVWHRQAPSWVFEGLNEGDPTSIDTLKSRMKSHIDAMIGRYGDVVDNWDVVNEAISDDGSKDYRDGAEGSDFYRIFQSEEYVYWAFKYTYDALEAQQQGSAQGKLYYNDYNVNLKVDRIIALLDAVRAQGVPVDGIGMQAHVRLDWPPALEIEQTIEKIVAAGYEVKISELDVSLYNDYPMGTFEAAPEVEFTEALEAQQADRYAELFALYREHAEHISSVSFWGISDDDTWLDDEPVAGRNDHPLLWDENTQPKQALEAIMKF